MKRKRFGLIIYYLAFLLVMVLWSNTSTAPPAIARIGFLLAIIIPSFIKDVPLLFPFLVFYTISSYGAAYSYMPSTLYLYALIAGAYFLYKSKLSFSSNSFSLPKSVTLLLVLTFLVNAFVNEGSNYTIFWSLLCIIFLSSMLRADNDVNLAIFSISFMIISLVLSVMFILIGQNYSEVYSTVDQMERMAWMDPNYFCCVVGMGALIALCKLISWRKKRIMLLFALVVFGASVFTIIAQASRGAVVALAVGGMVLLLYSRTKWIVKILLMVVVVFFIYELYNSSVLELLLYRMEQDTDGSGRLGIWSSKLEEFMNNGSVINFLFGMGWGNVMKLGNSGMLGVHNDYLAFFMEYGIVGFVLFTMSLCAPLFYLRDKKRRPVILALTSYLALCCFTLEPLTLGILVFFVFYVYIFYYSQLEPEQDTFYRQS